MPQISVADDPSKDDPVKVDLAIVARDLKLPPEKIEKTVELLDAGNTIPFITRFRKDLTGGLNEQQLLSVKQRVAQLRALAERKAFVIKSIESQGKLTDELKTQINKSSSSRRLEDLYLPFKPKKQSRASLARQQGLEPLAEDIFSNVSGEIDLATRATEFVRVDKGLTSVDEVIKGVGDLLAERFSENDELRSALRKIMWTDGKLASQAIAPVEAEPISKDPEKSAVTVVGKIEKAPVDSGAAPAAKPGSAEATADVSEATPAVEASSIDKTPAPIESVVAESTATETAPVVTASADSSVPASALTGAATEAAATEPAATEPAATEPAATEPAATEPAAKTVDAESTPVPATPLATGNPAPADNKAPGIVAVPVGTEKPKKKKKKKKKKKPVDDPFKDYHDFKQAIKQVPNHRILAINRGERAGNLKVKIQVEGDKLSQTAIAALVPENHPCGEFLKKCANDALARMVTPSLEREIRRELTETAEKHAVEVFANNLRNLLLQRPIRNTTVLAIDPGFKRGCSVAVLDPCGNLLESGHVFVVGNPARRDESKQKLVDWVDKFKIEVVAIGNGAACRQTEQLVSDTIAEKLQDVQVRYTMVNEAGASIYSTSEIGREELPDVTPSIRSAASIGRRLQDPLSELVKISPANIGVGMYQHDVKAKHLSVSLDDVVQFCVNRVGVDVNSASPSLLKYVSGLNALTARRVVEHRQAKGQFKNRNELKSVSGFGDATFVQAAGFLRIHGGDMPLDCTSIHPESYEIALDVLKRVDASIEEFFPPEVVAPKIVAAPPVAVAPVAAPPAAETPVAETPAAEAPVAVTSAEAPTVPQTEPGSIDADATPPPADDGSTKSVALASNEIVSSAEPGISADANSPEAPSSEPELIEASVKPALPKSESGLPADSSERLQRSEQRKEMLNRISGIDSDQLAQDHSAGKLLVKDILMALKRPKWDPRDKVSKPIFRRGIIKPDDLKPEMQLDGQIVNVVDFGVFVDIGLGESSLVHVSQLSHHFIRDPHRFYAVGDVLKVWVSEVDSERRRVKLTAVRPGSKKPQSRRQRGARPSTGEAQNKTGYKPGDKPAHKPGKYGGRSPKTGGRPAYGKSQHARKPFVRKSKPKEIKPITDKMLKGAEPMRSFSDLAQFVNKKPKDIPSDEKHSDEKKQSTEKQSTEKQSKDDDKN